jgi:hypothetical protein
MEESTAHDANTADTVHELAKTGSSARPAPLSIAAQLGITGPGPHTFDFSNAPHMRPARGKPPRRLTNAQVWEKVTRFLETGEIRHLPPRLRPEAAGILNWALEGLARGKPPWPGPGPEPGPDVPLDECARILMGDRADAESEIDR